MSQLLEYLNNLAKLDSWAINDLLNHRVLVEDRLADSDLVVVTQDDQLGLLGIINGYLDSIGENRIAAVWNEDGVLLRFEKYANSN